MKIRTMIIEDEKLARDLLKDYLNKFPELELIGEFPDGFSGLRGIQEQKPDIVFLDVQMPKLTGFELLEVLEDPPEIIFTTAFDQYAIKAFEHNAVDYLLKPFSEDRFGEAVSKAVARLQSKEKTPMQKLQEHFDNSHEALARVVVNTREGLKVIPTERILYLEAQDDYVMIYTADGKYIKQKTMKYFESHLDSNEFIRIHRSYIVRTDQINNIEPYTKDSWLVMLKSGQKVPVSRSGYKLIRETFDL